MSHLSRSLKITGTDTQWQGRN